MVARTKRLYTPHVASDPLLSAEAPSQLSTMSLEVAKEEPKGDLYEPLSFLYIAARDCKSPALPRRRIIHGLPDREGQLGRRTGSRQRLLGIASRAQPPTLSH